MSDTPRVADKQWNPEAMLDELMLEAQYDGGDAAASVSRRLREHALVAAESIAHLASHAGNERVRFQASQYIVEKVLEGSFDADRRLEQAQIQLFGQALAMVVRSLGLKFNFDPDAPEVKTIAHETLLELASGGT